MKLLSLECSTRRCSLALMVNGDPAFEAFWDSAGPDGSNARAHHESMIETIERARAEAGWQWDDIDWFIAGRGPGNYSGLRAALLTVQALAAPAGAPVSVVGSMDALAHGLMRQHEMGAITIIGDARRQSYWRGRCIAPQIEATPVAWETVARTELEQGLPGEGLIATPHWLETEWLRALHPGCRWIPEPQHPTALQTGRLAQLRKFHGSPPEPPVPLYAHPAV